MRIIRGAFCDEMMIISWNNDSIDWKLDKTMVNANTITLAAFFNDTELTKIQQYDREQQRNDEKIIVGAITFLHHNIVINPINLKGAVESGLITKLAILVTEDGYYSLESPALRLIENCAFKHLDIDICMPFTFQFSHADDVIRLINRYKGTLNSLTIYLEQVNMTAFSKIYKAVEHWIINTPTIENISLTARYINNRQCKSLSEYNDMQESLQFLVKCKSFSKRFEETTEKNQRDELCLEIINNNLEFTRIFSKYAPSKIEKVMGEHIYNIFLGYYIDYSIILNDISEWCNKEKGEPLPYNAKERIVKHIGGIGVIMGIDNALNNNNSMVYHQRDEEINYAEAMHDVNLDTSMTIPDCCYCLVM